MSTIDTDDYSEALIEHMISKAINQGLHTKWYVLSLASGENEIDVYYSLN